MANILTLNFPSSGGTKNFEYSISCTTAVSFSKDDIAIDWYTINHDTANKKISVYASNNTSSARTATIKTSVNGIDCEDKRIGINQEECIFNLPYLTFSAKENCTFTFTNSVQYTTGCGEAWSALTSGDSVTISAGTSIMWKAELTPSTKTNPPGIGTFSSNGKFEVKNNPMSLLYGDNFVEQTTLNGSGYNFYGLFSGCTGITSIDNLMLVATSLKQYCYGFMFQGCTNLTSIPSGLLPATTLADNCYYYMFADCTSLTSLPSGLLLATTLATNCYRSMFENCTSLTTIPSGLLQTGSTSNVGSYRHMFKGCSSLTTIPSNLLLGTPSASRCCEGMFADCTSLVTIPSGLSIMIKTSSEAALNFMFSGCTSLQNIPNGLLPSTTLEESCYLGMFANCTSLTIVPSGLLPATTLASDCYNGMFQGCTSLTIAPELHATTLATKCYWSMFNGCTSLTTAPQLLVTTLTDYCYFEMFEGCTNLNYIKCLATDISATDCTTDWVDGVASSGTFVKAASMNDWTTGANGIPNGWTVTNA